MRRTYLLLLVSSLWIAPLSHAGFEDLSTLDDLNDLLGLRLCSFGGGIVLFAGGLILGYVSGHAIYVASQCDDALSGKGPATNAILEYCHQHGSYTYGGNSFKWLGGVFGSVVSFLCVIFGVSGVVAGFNPYVCCDLS